MQEVIRRLLKGLLDVEASDLCTLTFESKKDGGNFFSPKPAGKPEYLHVTFDL